MKQKILIVEDEVEIAMLIARRLDENFYDVSFAKDGKEALIMIDKTQYDLVTVDIMIPFIDGFDISKEIRSRSKNALIMIVSALEREEDKLRAYALGADDYVSKPFSPKELAVKIKTLLQRRFELQSSTLFCLQDIAFDVAQKECLIAGVRVDFTPSEFLILETLFTTPKKVFSRDTLAQVIYDNGFGEIDARGIDTHIYQIRKKLDYHDKKEMLKTVHGMGYKLDEI